MPDRLTKATINLSNYEHNLQSIQRIVGANVRVMAVIKANAYGHGLKKIAEAAVGAGVSYLGVVSVGELKQIRECGLAIPVLVLNYVDAESLSDVLTHDGTICVMDSEAIAAAQTVAQRANKQLRVHLKIDTGMHRAGCDPGDVTALAEQINTSSNLELEGVFTHFAEADSSDDSFTKLQLQVFNQCLGDLRGIGINPELIHCANSAAIIDLPESHFTMVRPGLVTYGLNPFGTRHSNRVTIDNDFRPVLSLASQVMYIRTIAAGETVGYNRRWKAARTSSIALLAIGYGDGWRRGPQAAKYVLIGGHRAPVVGSVSMDQITVDITDIPNVSIGDEAVLIGAQGNETITVSDVASDYGTISYEVVTSLMGRIVRDYKQG